MKKNQKQSSKLRNKHQQHKKEYEDLFNSKENIQVDSNLQQIDKSIQEQQINQNRIQQCKSRSWHKRLDCVVNLQEIKVGKFSQEEVEYIMKVVNEYLLIQKNILNQSLLDSQRCGLQLQNKYLIEVLILFINQFEENMIAKIDKDIGIRMRRQTQSNMSNNMEENGGKLKKIGEFLILMKQIQNLTQQILLISNYDSILQTKFGNQFIETKFCLNFRKMNDFDRETFDTLKSLVQIPNKLNSIIKWTEIAYEIKTKTKDDLRQMWYKLGSQ